MQEKVYIPTNYNEMYMKATISKIKKETHDVKTFTLDLNEELKFKTGQFIRLTIPNCDIPRPFSISSQGGKSKQITLTIKIYKDGRFTNKIDKLNKGENVEIDGPYGHFIFEKSFKEDIVLICAGSGICTLHSIMEFIINNNLKNNINFLYSVKTPKDIIFGEKIKRLAKEKENLDFYVTITREIGDWTGATGRLTKKTLDKQIKNKKSLFYICGPSLFVKNIMNSLEELKINKESIKTERYGDDF
jgi:NAD(P)H-flavin reductase